MRSGVGRYGRNARGVAEGFEGKAESRRMQTRSIHLRQASRVGERFKENWGGSPVPVVLPRRLISIQEGFVVSCFSNGQCKETGVEVGHGIL